MNPEIENYLLKAQSFLNDCHILHQQGGSSASVVSRAYYATFYVAKALLLSIKQDTHTHQGTVAAFGLHFVKTGIFGRELGRNFADMLNKRMTGDYEIDHTILPQEAAICIKEAEDFYAKGVNYLQNKTNETNLK
jgi:uncharacterized protein (UPF0332 family)